MCAHAVEEVRRLYDTMTPVILEGLGHTYQAGTLVTAGDSPVRETNQAIADRAGLCPGMRVLDAGCGACGPAVDIARHVPGVSIEAVTLSPVQAEAGRAYVAACGFGDRVRVTVGDYHHLPFPDGAFEAAYFVESACYSADLESLFRETRRVLKPDGSVYVKDLFLEDRPLSPVETQAFAELNQAYRSEIRSTADYVRALRVAGFTRIRVEDTGLYGNTVFNAAMVRREGDGPTLTSSGEPELTAFGRAHWYPLALRGVTPVYVTDIRAEAPCSTTVVEG
ncbi:methyltransferase domain-containing protein [Streptomyces sp. NPDC053560]|uniref:methyltransferase domain-containing protein n=1 Tax=Streptomyces sp. NPDC053560 TaxID=3365711 RepID=UPI0037D33ADA